MPTMLTPNAKYRFVIREDSDDIVADGALVRETWIENVYRFPEDMSDLTVLDIGANIGVVSIFCASRGANVIAVEPEPDNLDYLHDNLDLNKCRSRVEVIEAAVGGESGYGWITDDRGNGKLYTKYPNRAASPCEVLSLHDLLERIAGQPDYCKIDIEGSEYPLFDAATVDDLNQIGHITMEFDGQDDLDVFGHLVAKICQYGNTHIIGRPTPLGAGGYIYSDRY